MVLQKPPIIYTQPLYLKLGLWIISAYFRSLSSTRHHKMRSALLTFRSNSP